MNGHVCTVVANVGALSNGPRPLFKIPSGFGGITVIGANAVQSAAGTTALSLCDLGTAGTLVASSAGTIATQGSTVYAANVQQPFTVSSAYVAEGHWVGVIENNVGACATVTLISLEYLLGK
jgi:hypothetical protein